MRELVPGELFIAEPTGRCMVVLRRYDHTSDPPAEHRHNADVIAIRDVVATPLGEDGYSPLSQYRSLFPPTDPRWPTRCASCGGPFIDQGSDHWQVNELDWFLCPNGRRFAHGIGHWRAPVGSMIRATWCDNTWPDNGCPAYRIELPNGNEWLSNQPSSRQGSTEKGPQWSVTGTPPKITVSPSIFCRPGGPKSWHGFIRNGRLEPCG